MATIPFDEAIVRFGENEVRFDDFVNSDTGYTTTDGVLVESIRVFKDRLENEILAYGELTPRVETLETEVGEIQVEILSINATLADHSTKLDLLELTDTGDDAGLNCIQQFSVGTPEAGKELVAGEGDSYPVSGAWHVQYSNIVGLNVVDAVDVTDILQSDYGSSTGIFDGTGSENVLLVMGVRGIFGGTKVKVATGGTIEPDNIAFEYLMDNTPTWAPSFYMATGADFPYSQYGNTIAANSSSSEQWRFTFDPDNVPSTWDEVTLNINGTDYTGRFAMLRTTSAITLDPIIEQMKLSPNRFEINADGNTEYFGRSRYPKDLHFDEYTNSDKIPVNEDISIATDVTIKRTDNELTASNDDGNIIEFTIPEGLDTSIPVVVTRRFYPMTAGTGDVKYDCSVYKISVGDTVGGAVPVSTELTNTIAIDDQLEELIETKFKFFVQDLVPGDSVVLDVGREGSATADTFPASVANYSSRVVGYFWRP